MLLLGCRSGASGNCQSARPFSRGGEGEFYFSNAIVKGGLYSATITPLEFLNTELRSEYVPISATFASVRLARKIKKVGSVVVMSGRGHWAQPNVTFQIDGICEVAPLKVDAIVYAQLEPPHIEPECYPGVGADCSGTKDFSTLSATNGSEILFSNAVIHAQNGQSTIGGIDGSRTLPVLFGLDRCSCSGHGRPGREVEKAGVAIVSGRGYWDKGASVFYIRCFCSVKPANE